ncbi:MAG: hypothetical protein AB1564_16980 [Chloroflexota bacterium]
MRTIKGLKIAALIPLGLAAAILLMFAAGETLGGDWSGLGHLVPLAFIGLLMWLGWKRPIPGGIALLAGALLAASFFADALRGPGWLAPFLIFVAPLALSGLLFLSAGRLGRK